MCKFGPANGKAGADAGAAAEAEDEDDTDSVVSGMCYESVDDVPGGAVVISTHYLQLTGSHLGAVQPSTWLPAPPEACNPEKHADGGFFKKLRATQLIRYKASDF